MYHSQISITEMDKSLKVPEFNVTFEKFYCIF